MSLRTPLYRIHLDLGARMVPFGGWEMPLHYGSQLQEHHAVRRDAGMFDVSHMSVVDLQGEQVRAYLRRLLANDVARLSTPGKALYSCMLQQDGGVLDDLIVYFLRDDWYRMVVNAATSDKDLAWMHARAEGFDLTLGRRDDLAMIAVQGPGARVKVPPHLPAGLEERAAELKPFHAAHDAGWFVGRTGYTGEDGFEVMLPAADAPGFWQAMRVEGVAPCGLGARDTLRLEAGMNLYGTDMDESVTPLEAGLGWTLAWEPADREFIGRSALEAQRSAGGLRRFVGLVLEGKGVLRNQQKLFEGEREIGAITSGGFAPTLERSVALARVAGDVGARCQAEIRGRRIPARVVQPPFVRNGKALVNLDP
jgi:aminomethyltransferase